MKTEISKKQFTVYIIAAFILGWIIEFTASIFANKGDADTFKIIMACCMFAPLLSVLIAGIQLKGMGFIPHLKGKIRYIFFSLWIPALLSIIGGALFFVIFPNAYDGEFTVLRNMMEEAGVLEQMEARGLTFDKYLIISTVSSLTIAPIFNIIFALGEEIGWRGAMYPYLKEKLGVTKGRIVGGVIWGCWHWPVMILAGYEYGKDYLGAPVLGPVVFCISTVMMGILLDYVYEKTETIWMPALMHGAINAFTIFAYIVKPEYADKAILGPMHIGIISMIPMVILTVIISVKTGRSDKA